MTDVSFRRNPRFRGWARSFVTCAAYTGYHPDADDLEVWQARFLGSKEDIDAAKADWCQWTALTQLVPSSTHVLAFARLLLNFSAANEFGPDALGACWLGCLNSFEGTGSLVEETN